MRDQLIFPEIDYNKVEKVKGMNISITTTAKTDAEGLALLKQHGHAVPAIDDEKIEQTSKVKWQLPRKSRRMKDRSTEKRQRAEVRMPAPQPLFPLRTAARLSAQVPPVPDLFPELALAGEIPGVTKASW